MLSQLSRIPVQHQQPIASGLLLAAIATSLFGSLMAMGFTETTKEECTGHLFLKKCVEAQIPLSVRITYLLAAIALFAVALTCVAATLKLMTMQGHLKRYEAILTGVESLSVPRIAEITNSRPTKVRTEIQGLIDSGLISDFYIDYSADQVHSRKYVPKTSHKTVVKCSECGGNNEMIVGITKHCSFCGQPLLLGTT